MPRIIVPALLGLLLWSCDRERIEVSEASPADEPSRQAGPAGLTGPAFQPTRVEHANGLVVEKLSEGRALAASPGRRVTFHCVGRVEGSEEPFVTTRKSGIPWSFLLGQGELIPGLERGLAGARAGARLRLTVPPGLAYGEEGAAGVPPGSTLVFEIEMVRVE